MKRHVITAALLMAFGISVPVAVAVALRPDWRGWAFGGAVFVTCWIDNFVKRRLWKKRTANLAGMIAQMTARERPVVQHWKTTTTSDGG